MGHKTEWTFYLLGAFLALAWKWARYCYIGRVFCSPGKKIRQASLEWFFEVSQENLVSWATTVGIVWCLGAIYIDRIVNPAALTDIPVEECFAFLLGTLLEFIAPNIVKWIVSKIPGASGS